MLISPVYKTGRDHLSDELHKIGLLLQMAVYECRRRFADDRPDHLRGLYITDSEVDGILPETPEAESMPSPPTLKDDQKIVLEIQKIRESIINRVAKSVEAGVFLPLPRISEQFRLTPPEQDVLLLCLAAELDAKYGKIFAYIHDDVTRKWPTPGLALDLFFREACDRNSGRFFFSSHGALLQNHLIELSNDDPNTPLLSRSMRLDPGLTDYLLELNTLDFRLIPFTRILPLPKDKQNLCGLEAIREEWRGLAHYHRESGAPKPLVFYLYGPDGGGKHTAARYLAGNLGLSLLAVDTRRLIQEPDKTEKLIRLAFRETALHPCCLCLEYFDHLFATAGKEPDERMELTKQRIISACRTMAAITFLLGEKNWSPDTELSQTVFVAREFPVPGYHIRKKLWEEVFQEAAPDYRPAENVDTHMLANKFQFTPGQTKNALNVACSLALMGHSGNNGPVMVTDAHLHQACRSQSNQKLAELAQKIIPRYTWDDIVLPPDKLEQLREIYQQVKFRHVVFHEWDFDSKFSLGKGVNVMFSGSSGTGKTMAAEIIAKLLDMDLYKIDLSSVVSKYIGETEKNLSKIFQEARASNAILLFDEADALFGKRSEVKDAHDRYANIEINYLLQKMEEHEGIVILTTNFKKNIDDAFTRRFRFTVEFPFPDPPYRLRIWKQVFPMRTPIGDDLDFDYLARRFKITGGNIKNIALHSAFLAAADGRVVRMAHLVRATRREIHKMGELCQPGDFGKYAPMLDS